MQFDFAMMVLPDGGRVQVSVKIIDESRIEVVVPSLGYSIEGLVVTLLTSQGNTDMVYGQYVVESQEPGAIGRVKLTGKKLGDGGSP